MKINQWNLQFNLKEPACLYKWQQTTVYLSNQTSATCHRIDAIDISLDNFGDFHNTAEVINDREKMLSGKWPGRGCEYCKNIEDAGGHSDRQVINNDYHKILKLTPKEIKENTNTNDIPTRVTPSTLEVYFSNLCNQACLYCFPRYSSRIENEFKRYGIATDDVNDKNHFDNDIKKFEFKRKNYEEAKIKFWHWMHTNARELKDYHILGGEPFYQDEIFENINFFKNNRCPDLHIQIFTNLNVNTERVRKILEEFRYLLNANHIKSLTLMCSIDTWGPAEEYVRSGSKNEIWKKNWDMLCNEFGLDFRIHIHSTLCNLSIKSSIDLVRLYNDSSISKYKKNKHGFSLAGGHNHLHIGIFPDGFFDECFDQMTKEVTFEPSKEQLLSFKKLTNFKPYNPKLIYKLKNYLDVIDKRRNMNWKETLPWLESFNPEDYKE